MRRSFLLVVAALALTGCGTTASAGNFAGEQATVAKVIDNLSTYGKANQASNICNKIFAPSVATKLKAAGGTCDSVVGDALKNVDIFTLTVQKVTISADKAIATVKSTSNGKDQVKTLNLVHQTDGTWRITSIG